MAITHKFRGLTILFIKIVSPRNKIRIRITKRIHIWYILNKALNPNNLTVMVALIPLVGIFNKPYKIPNEHHNTLCQIIKRF